MNTSETCKWVFGCDKPATWVVRTGAHNDPKPMCKEHMRRDEEALRNQGYYSVAIPIEEENGVHPHNKPKPPSPLTITELSRRWYNYVSLDHHKDRDCHFYVEKKWSYGEEPVYYAYHYGYRAHDWHSGPHLTAADAEEALLKWLTHTVNGTIMDTKERLANPEEVEWISEDQLQRELDALEGR